MLGRYEGGRTVIGFVVFLSLVIGSAGVLALVAAVHITATHMMDDDDLHDEKDEWDKFLGH